MDDERKPPINVKREIRIQASIIFTYVDNLYNRLHYLFYNEQTNTEAERDAIFKYGYEKAKLNLVRLANIKKALRKAMDKLP